MRSSPTPPWIIPPSRPLPIGSASTHFVEGLSYQSTRCAIIAALPFGRGRRTTMRNGADRRGDSRGDGGLEHVTPGRVWHAASLTPFRRR